MPQVIEVVVGGQYGSEAKGHVTAQLVRAALDGAFSSQAQVINIRVAGPNAGHSVIDAQGRKFAFRQVPVGAVLGTSEREALCYIAPGSEIDLPVLLEEIDQVSEAGYSCPIYISGEATMIRDEHKELEAEQGLTVASGNSTGKGIGAARADRAMRHATRLKDDPDALQALNERGVFLMEPVDLYADDLITAVSAQHIIIEGTQGYGLGLHSGNYPKVTSSDCTAIDFMAMAGIQPWRIGMAGLAIWVVARAYPIRIAGDSGPLKDETTWAELGLPEEYTTVTKKVRRVGLWDGELVKRAVQANGGASAVRVALTMADQKFPAIAGLNTKTVSMPRWEPTPEQQEGLDAMADWATDIKEEIQARICMVTTSPSDALWIEVS